MSYIKTLNDRFNSTSDIFSYSDFNETVASNTINMLNYTNNYAKRRALSLNESIEDISIDYDCDMKKSIIDITDAVTNIINESHREIYTKFDRLQDIVKNHKGKIITTILPNCSEYELYENFFNPNFDILQLAIDCPNEDIIARMLGQKRIFTSDNLNGKQNEIFKLIDEIQIQLSKNKIIVEKMIPESNDKCDFSSSIDLKNKCTTIVDGYKRVNKAFHQYHFLILTLLIDFNNGDQTTKPDKLENEIEIEKTYDSSQINECFTNIQSKIYFINAQLENIAIKYGLEALNESSNNNKQQSRYASLLTKIWEALKAICRFIRDTWIQLVRKIKISLDRYGKWARKYKEPLLAKIDKEGSFEDNVCHWNWTGKIFILEKIGNASSKIMKNISIGSSIDDYNDALKMFSRYSNGDTRENIYNTIMNTEFKIRANNKISDPEKIKRIIEKYRTDARRKTITKSDVKKYLNVLESSNELLRTLNDSDRMMEVNRLSENLARDLEKVKTKMNTGAYSEEEAVVINKYYSARKMILDVAKVAAKDIYQINYRLIYDRTHEAYMVLKNFLKNKSMDESIDFNADTYIQLGSIFESSSDLCMTSELSQGGLISKDANINDLIPEPVSTNIRDKIISLKLYPISKLVNNTILMRSDIDKNIWVYNIFDKSLVCQNTLNSVFSN